MPGPVPKRSEERRRRNKPDGAQLTKGTGTSAGDFAWPDPDSDWHPLAVDLYLGLKNSGMAQFYESSDIAVARYVCEATSRNLKDTRMSGQMFSSIISALTNLGATEGDRRRLRIELDRTEPETPPSVTLMEEYRRAAGADG